MPRADWFKMVEGRPSAKSKGSERRDRIVSIDFSGPQTAFAKVECQIPPRYFTDYLTSAEGRRPLAGHRQGLPHGDEGVRTLTFLSPARGRG